MSDIIVHSRFTNLSSYLPDGYHCSDFVYLGVEGNLVLAVKCSETVL